MIICIRHLPKEKSTRISEYSKCARGKINIKKSIVFLITRSKQLRIETKMPFLIDSIKKMKLRD